VIKCGECDGLLLLNEGIIMSVLKL